MNEPTKPTYEELEQQINILRQQRTALSTFNLDWEARFALQTEQLRAAQQKIIELTPKKK